MVKIYYTAEFAARIYNPAAIWVVLTFRGIEVYRITQLALSVVSANILVSLFHLYIKPRDTFRY